MKRRNRHHILYPRIAWLRLGPRGTYIRGMFVVRINSKLHEQLHREIDPTLGGFIWTKRLPSRRTLKYLEKELRKDEQYVRKLKPVDRIDWLMQRLSYKDNHSHWLKTMLRRQREFFVEHSEEI